MSFNQKVNGRGYAPGFFLASADCDRETVEVSASHAQAVTIGDKKKVLEAGDGYYVAPDELHGCICLEEGVLIDVFSPIRADFLGI